MSSQPQRALPSRLQLCLAIEVRPDALSPDRTTPLAAMLSPDLAGALAAKVAADLATFDARAAELELITCGALYDPVEVLRRTWRLHTELENLAARAPRKPAVAPAGETLAGQGRVIAFGAAEGNMPGILQPDAQFGVSALLLLPINLQGEPAIAEPLAAEFERILLERGMASAETALFVQEAFEVPIEHARYLTAWDLAAMMQLQYRHAGLESLWPLIEACALTDPPRTAELSGDNEPPAQAAEGIVTFAELPDDVSPAVKARQRQLQHVLAAHGIPTAQA